MWNVQFIPQLISHINSLYETVNLLIRHHNGTENVKRMFTKQSPVISLCRLATIFQIQILRFLPTLTSCHCVVVPGTTAVKASGGLTATRRYASGPGQVRFYAAAAADKPVV